MATIILLLIGVTTICLSGEALWRAIKLYLVGRRTTGALLCWRHIFYHRWLGNGQIMQLRHYHPVVRFEAPDGSHHDVVSELAYDNVPDWPVGRPFAVRYEPGNPRVATIDPLDATWIFPAVFLIAGLVILCATLRPLLSAF